MSFYDDASLVFLPSSGAGKDGKAYSIKPTNGDGDFTFSRGSNLTATRIDSNGLIAKGRENLLKQSNNFGDTSAWIQSQTTRSSGEEGYDGTSDAWEIVRASGGGLALYQMITNNSGVNTALSGVNTFSIYVKVNSSNGIGLAFASTSVMAQFDISDDSKTAAVVENGIIASKQEYVGNNFYRLSVTADTSASNVRLYTLSANGASVSVSGATYIVQDAQTEIGLVATEYIESSGATTGLAGILEDSPRFDYSGGASCPSLLLEPSRTNLIGYSEYLSSIFSGIRMDINDLVDTSPEGFINASKLIPDTTPNSTHQSNTGNYGSFVSGDKITISIFAKADGFDGIILRFLDGSGAFTTNRIAKFDLSRGRWENSSMDGTIGVMEGEVGMEALGNGWYRCFATATADATGDVDIRIPVADVTTQDTYNEVFTGDGTKGVLIYGLQLEQASYPTSYIPNHSGGSVTREAEDIAITTLDQTYSTDITIFLEVERLVSTSDINKEIAVVINSTTPPNNRFTFYSTSNGRFRALIIDDSGNSDNLYLPNDAFEKGETIKVALKITSSGCTLFVDGSSVDTSSGIGRILGIDRISFFRDSIIKQYLMFPTALSDNNCITLTS